VEDERRGKEKVVKNSRGRTCFHTTNILSIFIMGLMGQKMML
jgi:hypothetical protein